MNRYILRWFFSLAVALNASPALAITIPTVPIGNPGNAADTRYIDTSHPNGVGAVAQSFNIGTTEVTNAQYVALLNAVAASDPYLLYNAGMTSDSRGGIVRSGAPGSYTYSVKAPALNGAYTYDNKPVIGVGSDDAMRFANWLQNGQPTGIEGPGTTETGAYTLNGAFLSADLVSVTRNSNAKWWLPSENEWYKAAYYDPFASLYHDYPTRTNSIPDNNLPANDTGNSANYYGPNLTTGSDNFPLTDVGAYALSASPYGTFDQGGSVWEFNETLFSGSLRGLRGASWRFQTRPPPFLHASLWSTITPNNGGNDIGFRLATIAVPEPSTLCIWTSALFCLFAARSRE